MKADSDKAKVAEPRQRRPARESVVTASKFILTDGDGKERISLFVQQDIAMFALCDKNEVPRLLIAVQPDGSALISATHPGDDGQWDDCFRLIISNGEPEIIMRDAIFKDCTTISPRGVSSPASA